MSFANELVNLLTPLGVYSFREGSYSLGELQALGGALDQLDEVLRLAHRESMVASAENTGLERMEALFRYTAPSLSIHDRRNAIAGFLRISGDGFTPEALGRCLAACGVSCTVTEDGPVNRVTVRFPGVMGIPAAFPSHKTIIEDILPCQLGITYYFRYCTWGETRRYGLRWRDLRDKSWYQWRVYTEEPGWGPSSL